MSTAKDTSRIRRLIVGCGGDRKSRDAVALGAVIAEALGAELHIGLILKTQERFVPAYPPVGDISGILAGAARTWLDEAESTIPEAVSSQRHVRENHSVAEGLLTLAEEIDADLIITGSGIGAGRRRLHPVVDALLHSSPVPVALAPHRYSTNQRLTHVLAAVAGGRAVHQVLDRGADWAAQLGLPLSPVTLQEQPQGVDSAQAADQLEATTAALTRENASLGSHGALDEPLVGAGRTMAKAVRSIPWPEGGILLIGSSRLAGGHRTFLSVTAARILAHLPIPMVVMPRTVMPSTDEPAEQEPAEQNPDQQSPAIQEGVA